MSLSAAAGPRRERVNASPQRKDGKFRNPSGLGPNLKGDRLPVLKDFFLGGARRKPPGKIPTFDPREPWLRAPESRFRVTWLGHSTILLEMDGLRVLTDPVFGERVSPVSFAGPRRFHPIPVGIDALPELDAVLLSHDHFDHLCAGSMQQLARRDVPFVTALGVGARLESCGVRPERIVELDWHESADLCGGALRFTATPAQHFSGRGLGDRNDTLWASWVIQTDRRRVFFSGDTGLFPEMADIGKRYGPFDLTMLEVGAFHPAWSDIHLGPENGLRAHALLGGGLLLPVHWGTFDLALHTWDDPAETLYERAKVERAPLLLPRLGVPIEPSRERADAPWWRSLQST